MGKDVKGEVVPRDLNSETFCSYSYVSYVADISIQFSLEDKMI